MSFAHPSDQVGPPRPTRSGSTEDRDAHFGWDGIFLPRFAKDGRSLSNAGVVGTRGASLASIGVPPGSFNASVKAANGPRNATVRHDSSVLATREDFRTDDVGESERRQADFTDKINKETKIKTGSENLLEALLAKNAKQTKDQRMRVEKELSSSNRKIAELKILLEEEIERSKRPATPNQSRLSGLFRGSPLRSPSRIESVSDLDHSGEELEAESPTYVLAEILQALEMEGMQPDYYVERANGLVELFKRHPTLKYDLAWSIFGLRVQTMLLSRSREVVAAGFRVTRHAITDRKSLQVVRSWHSDSLVILSLVKESKATIEREQALKFVRSFLDVKEGVYELSTAVVRTVVSIAEQSEDRLRNIAILTLSEILTRNPSLIVAAGGITTLADALVDGSYPGSESLISTFIYLNDTPQYRSLLDAGRELEAPFASFTDPLIVHGSEDRLKTNARAVANVLCTWPGLFILARSGFATIRSLLLSLSNPIPFTRDLVLDILFDILHIKPPSWTSSFLAGRRLTTYGRVANLRAETLDEKSRVESEDDSNRVNLVEHYTALILAIFIDCGLLKSLSDLMDEATDLPMRRKTTLLLGEVLKLANYALPSGLSAKLHILPTLVNNSFDSYESDEMTGSDMAYQLDSVNRTMHRLGRSPNNRNSLGFANLDINNVTKMLEPGKPKLSFDMDEIQFRSLLVETQVVSTVNYLKWKWDLINDIIEGPLLNPRRLEDAIKPTKFLKRLIGFYRPFKYRFSEAKNTKPNQRYVRTGCALLKCLLQTGEGRQYLLESKLLRQLAECLAQLDRASVPSSTSPLFAVDRVSETLVGGYFALLGALSSEPEGLAMLSRWRMINMFYHIVNLKERDDLIRLLLGNMDFTLDSHLRVILSKVLTSCPKAIRIYATKLLRKYATRELHTAEQETPSLAVAYWAIRLLVTQLYDPDVEVSEVAVHILQEACHRNQYLEYIVKCRPALDHLGEIGAPLLLRFLSTSLGYQYLDDLDYITQEMDDWFLGRNEKYVTLVEASLNRALSYDSDRPRSTIDVPLQHQQLGIVPPHFYRELTRTKEGCTLLKSSGHFEEFVSTIQESWSESRDPETMLKVKGCLWAVGNVGSMELGAPFIEQSDVVSWIIKVVEGSEVMSMRGTAFFVLGLISRSLHGMEILAERGWDAATDHLGQSLGYCLPPSLIKLFSVWNAPRRELPFSGAKEPFLETLMLQDMDDDDDPVQARIISLITDLGNTVLTKRAAGELHRIKGRRPGLFGSAPLFRKAMIILERHNFRLPVRRFILDLFDKDVLRQVVLDDNSDEEEESQPATARRIVPR